MKKKPTDLGLNRTGIQMSPKDAGDVTTKAKEVSHHPDGFKAFQKLRHESIREADAIGTVPIPGNIKGVLSSAAKKITGEKPEVFIDCLGARLAFERTGVRLYDALIAKVEIQGNNGVPGLTVENLRHFQLEELRHFEMVRDAMETIGADPTAVTPAADIDGVASMGLIQVVSDPRTTVEECLNAVLIAELADNDGWALLIGLADSMGFDEIGKYFRQAKAEEDIHLRHFRDWLTHAVISREARAA